MSNGLMTNDLIAFPGPPNLIQLYIQFIMDVNTDRTLQSNGPSFFMRIYNEINKSPLCLGYSIKYNLMPTSGLPEGAVNKNFKYARDPALRNPFQPWPHGVTPPVEPLHKEEKDAFNNPLTSADPPAFRDPPALPIIRFYLGDGESLNQDIVGLGSDLPIDQPKAKARYDHNFTHNFDFFARSPR